MRYGRELSSLLAEPWDLVHCWEEPYVAAAYQIARQVAPDVPLVFATFQNIAKRYPPPFNWIERYSMNRADGIIAFGRTIADVLASKDRGRVSVRRTETRPRAGRGHSAGRGPRSSSGPTRPAGPRRWTRLGWSDGPPVVGFLGRFVPEKGLAAADDGSRSREDAVARAARGHGPAGGHS